MDSSIWKMRKKASRKNNSLLGFCVNDFFSWQINFELWRWHWILYEATARTHTHAHWSSVRFSEKFCFHILSIYLFIFLVVTLFTLIFTFSWAVRLLLKCAIIIAAILITDTRRKESKYLLLSSNKLHVYIIRDSVA